MKKSDDGIHKERGEMKILWKFIIPVMMVLGLAGLLLLPGIVKEEAVEGVSETGENEIKENVKEESGESTIDSKQYYRWTSFGPSDKWTTDGNISRYISDGKFGFYDKITGERITEPIYADASKMVYGIATAWKDPDNVFFIDSSGKKFSETYMDAYEFGDNNFAIVQTEDKKWGIIDHHGELVFSGADSIPIFSADYDVITAIVDGHPVLLKRTYDELWRTNIKVEKKLEDYTDISDMKYGLFAVVKDEYEDLGIVTKNGEVIVPAEYSDIEYEMFRCERGEDFCCILFLKLFKPDGKIEFRCIDDLVNDAGSAESGAVSKQDNLSANSPEPEYCEYPEWMYDDGISRHVSNGRIRFFDNDSGKPLTEQDYIYATEMKSGIALVFENTETAYYINGRGERFTEKYADGSAFCEGFLARVKEKNGSWGLINDHGECVFSGADKIPEFSGIYDTMTAVIDGVPMLLSLSYDDAGRIQCKIKARLNGYTDISDMKYGLFAEVTGSDGKKGVISYNGEIIAPPNYELIGYDIFSGNGEEGRTRVLTLKLTGSDGQESFMNYEFK